MIRAVVLVVVFQRWLWCWWFGGGVGGSVAVVE